MKANRRAFIKNTAALAAMTVGGSGASGG
ncbi:twin-arginine translocation signal domain-containing protein [Parapedobacter sp. ISTM3]|nr:twin-arginine translocation signal domain-containing protein [Parapedobacter sp. ISTM3]